MIDQIDITTDPRPHCFLAPRVRRWLETATAKRLAEGGHIEFTARDLDESADMVSLLGLRFSTSSVCSPLTLPSSFRLLGLVANPDQPVCDLGDLPEHHCNRYHVDSAAVDEPRSIAHVHWFDLPQPEAEKWEGRFHHGVISIYRDHAGDQYAAWSDSDPTKGGAWRDIESIDLDEAASLIALKTK